MAGSLITEKDQKEPKRTKKDRKGPKRTPKGPKRTEKKQYSTEKGHLINMKWLKYFLETLIFFCMLNESTDAI